MAATNQRGHSELRFERPQAAYYEIEGIGMKISEKFRFAQTSSHQVDVVCLTLRDINILEKYDYDFHIEHSVLQNIGVNMLK